MDEQIRATLAGTWAKDTEESLCRIADALEQIAKALAADEPENQVSR